MRSSIGVALSIAGIALSAHAKAEPAASAPSAAACATAPAGPPAVPAGWAGHSPLAAADSPAGTEGATIEIGRAVDARLIPTGKPHYELPPEKPGGPASHGGLFGFAVAEAGTYRVALGSGAWVDVVRDGKAVRSSAHGHGPACSGIRKMVDFALQPGRYVLQVAASAAPTLPMMIARAP